VDRQSDNILDALGKTFGDSLKKNSPALAEASELLKKQVQGFMDRHDQEFEAARREVEESLKRGMKPRKHHVGPL